MFKAHKSADISVQETALIGSNITIEGKIVSSATIHLAGTHKGDISCETLLIEESGSVTGKVSASEVRIAGQLSGEIETESLQITRTAKIEGALSYQRIEIEDGATVEGQFLQKKPSVAVEKE